MKPAYLTFALPVLLAVPVFADPKLPAIISNDMILQRNLPVPIWGTADPGEQITVTFAGQTQKATADANGNWQVKLAPLQAAESLVLTVAGKTTVTISNVAVGEVWLASGQSNMSFTVSGDLRAKESLATADDPGLRLFLVPRASFTEPAKDVNAKWRPAKSDAVRPFPAAAYFMARALRENLKVPIGVIGSSIPGSSAQAWTPRTSLEADPTLKRAYVEGWDRSIAGAEAAKKKYETETLPAWQKQADDAKAANTEAPAKPEPPKGVSMTNGDPIHYFNGMIAPLAPYGLAGAIWYQGESNAGKADQYIPLLSSMIKGWRSYWGQGDFPFAMVQLANLGEQQTAPAEGGWAQIRDSMRLITQTVPKTGIAWAGDLGKSWELHPPNKSDIGRRLALWAEATVYGQKIEYVGPLYDSMKVEGNKIRVKFTHAQGLKTEDNSARFGDELVSRRAEIYNVLDILKDSNLLTDSPVAYTTPDKPLTRRQLAQLITWFETKLTANNWTLETVTLKDGTDREKFKTAYARSRSALVWQLDEIKKPWAGELRGFAISGADAKWVWATATIEGDSVIVTSPEVAAPTAVRYSWAGNPIGNLTNSTNLPAPSFQTGTK